jgi:uncharacterized protein YkwD
VPGGRRPHRNVVAVSRDGYTRRLVRPARPTRHVRLLVAVASLALFATLGATGAQARIAADPDVDPGLERQVLVELNLARRAQGVVPLRRSGELTAAARAHATSMGRLGFFSHTSDDGTSATRRIASFYEVDGSSDWAVSEIIQWSQGTPRATEALAAWLDSDHHRRELARPYWREAGVGIVHVEDAPGVFGGRDVTILVVDFGRR